MTFELLYSVNQWVLFATSVALLYASAEIGFRLGRRSAAEMHADSHSRVATIEGALLGLLALLLGFAFAMSMNRFEARKDLVLEEANNLQTAYLRAKLLPEPHGANSARLLREYLGYRVDYYKAGDDMQRARAALNAAVAVQAKMWAEAVAAVRRSSDEVTTGYFVETLNQLIDDEAKRTAAMSNHVPEAMLWLLLLMACFTVAVTGYSSGLGNQRLVGLRFILSLLIAATLLVIVDLDRPRRGLIEVSENSIVSLRSQLDIFDR